MMLRYSFDYKKEADMLDKAITNVLNNGIRTADIATGTQAKVSTSQMGDAIVDELKNLLK
jgi:3-isopropylmalate dehydrogenase